MVTVDNIRVSFNGKLLFEGVNFQIKPGQRVGLIGKNGAGKSTLLKVLSREVEVDEGSIIIGKEQTLGYLKQDLAMQGNLSVKEEAEKAFEAANQLQEELDRLSHELTIRTDYESESYSELIQKVSDLGEQLSLSDDVNIEGKVEKILLGLGFERKDLSRNIQEFSGGWRMRVELAKILLQEPDILLLDEPTNHLDIVSIQWLEKYLKSYAGIIVLISHDQQFLDQVTNRTIEIVNRKTFDFNLPYSKYLEQKEIQFEQMRAAKANQDKKVEDMEKFIERFRAKATKSNQVQSRIKQLEKIDRIESEEHEVAAMKIRFPDPTRGSKQVVAVEEVTKSYGDSVILDQVSLIIGMDEKVAFVGKNGMGKSTLLKIIVDEIEATKGSCVLGQNTSLGYYAQNQAEELDLNKTVFETIDDIAKGDIRLRIRDMLGAFLFSGEDIDKKVSVLSGGEKARLALCKLLLEPYNFLVLDEPTNHLDILSKQILKDALVNYKGTLLLVSHDREFLRGIADKVYEFKYQQVREFAGDIDFYLDQKKDEEDDLKMVAKKETSKPVNAGVKNKREELQEKSRKKKLENRLQAIEASISEIEKEKAELEHKLALKENANDPKLYQKFQIIENDLVKKMADWEACAESIEELS